MKILTPLGAGGVSFDFLNSTRMQAPAAWCSEEKNIFFIGFVGFTKVEDNLNKV